MLRVDSERQRHQRAGAGHGAAEDGRQAGVDRQPRPGDLAELGLAEELTRDRAVVVGCPVRPNGPAFGGCCQDGRSRQRCFGADGLPARRFRCLYGLVGRGDGRRSEPRRSWPAPLQHRRRDPDGPRSPVALTAPRDLRRSRRRRRSNEATAAGVADLIRGVRGETAACADGSSGPPKMANPNGGLLWGQRRPAGHSQSGPFTASYITSRCPRSEGQAPARFLPGVDDGAAPQCTRVLRSGRMPLSAEDLIGRRRPETTSRSRGKGRAGVEHRGR